MVFLGFYQGNKNSENFSTFFETNHTLTAESISEALKIWSMLSANSSDELDAAKQNGFL